MEKISIQNSELKIAKHKRAFLTYPTPGLVSCTLDETDDMVTFIFDAENLTSGSKILNHSIIERYRFLYNCGELFKLSNEYDFSTSPDNLCFDINLRPYVLMRDICNENNFLHRYKALLGCILQSRYNYEDYLKGGQDLYKKNKSLSHLAEMETVSDIQAQLMVYHQEESEKIKNTKMLVDKRSALISRLVIPALSIILAVVCFFGWQSIFQDGPYKDRVIAASNSYIAGNYLSVQHELDGLPLSTLTHEAKYILARSYVITESLTDEQKENALAGLSLRADAIFYDYWIYMGRLQFDEAIDIAQRLSEDELLLFAYLKYQVLVRNDTTISGEEKTALINDLDNKINTLRTIRDAAASDDR
jgi:type VII secretion protein EssB